MDLRMKIYQELINSQVTEFCDDRIFQVNSIFTPPRKKPFVAIRMGIANADRYPVGSVFTTFQLWVHDEPGDYHQIDQIHAAAKFALLSASREPGFFEFRWVEAGQDMEDDNLNTIMRLARYQAVTVEPLPTPQL
jgi:hypothetical protein